MAQTIIWGDGPLRSWVTTRRGIVVSLTANPRSRQDQPELKLCLVPSNARAEIERWVRAVVSVDAAEWWAEVSSTETRLVMGANRTWEYNPTGE